MARKSKRWMVALTFSALTACGHKDDPAASAPQTAAAPENGDSRRCGQDVATDYRELKQICAPGPTGGCREAAESFLRSYPQVSCTVVDHDERFGQVRELRIDAREVRELLNRFRRDGF
jgi:hypothetical protein